MGIRHCAALGTVALTTSLLATAAPASAAGSQSLEAERMKVRAGTVVRVPEAAGGRAVALRSTGSATKRFVNAQPVSIVLRTRALGCGRMRQIAVTVDNGVPHVVQPKTGWGEQRVNLTLLPGTHRIKLVFSGIKRKRCRALVDRVRLPVRKPKPVAPGPVAPPTATIGRYVPLGASVQSRHFKKDPGFEETFRREFVAMTPENEMKMEWLQPDKGKWNFEPADHLVDYAKAHGKAVRGHALVFGSQTPPWVDRLLFSDEAAAALREHIFTVVGRYKHHVREWDVVNEALGPDGHFRPNAWLEKLGSRYVDLAFQFAREADPTAKLYYNEFDADVRGQKREATAHLVKRLKDKGLVDGVGLQMHTSLAQAPTRESLEDTLRLYEAMGLEVQITEMDVLAGGQDALTDRLNIQAGVYRHAAEACAAVRACTRFTVWGVSDKYSWMGVEQLPLLLDASNQPKPALAAVREVLGG